MVNGKKPWHKVSARFIAALSAAAMIATLTISGTAFALGNDATDSGTSDADQSSTNISQDTAKQTGKSTEPQVDTQQESPKTADTPATTAVRAANVGTVVGATPSNTTMDLFDYWLTGQNDRDDNDDIAATLTRGINSNGHELKFLRKSYGTEGGKQATDVGSLNAWTGSSGYNAGGPFSGMVSDTLSNGYPMLNAGQYYQGQATSEGNNRLTTDTNETTQQQSLSYLFNPQECSPSNGCAAYQNVTGLLQQGTNGIYSYDSQQNFASIDTTTNKFTLYNAPAVNAGAAVADQSNGQFFPFNTADQVFNSNNGTQSTLTSTNQVLNHYFGLHMSTTFTQPTGGQVNGQDMVFNFTGDDDVWVFIDGKLVGDVGGLHDRLSLSINFRTGDVTVADGSSQAGSNPRIYSSTTLKDTLGLTNATFTSGSEHTLDFFYLERGNGNSNLKLETNLVYHPANELLKVDQVGNPIPDVTFDLYEADENGKKTNNTPSATGTTDANGKFTFKNKDNTNKLLTLSELYADGAHPDYVLVEKEVPTGYRKAGNMHLRLQKDKQGNVYATSVNKFETGAIAAPRVQTTITAEQITGERQNQTVQDTITDNMLNNGRIVAVAMRFNSSATCPDGSTGVGCWQAVVGNAENGWSEQGTGFAGVLQAAQQNYAQHGADYNAFVKNENGQWSADVHDLPGEVGEYYYAIVDPTKADVNYSIGYFYIPNSAIQYADSTDTSGMYRLDSEGYERQYASVIEVPNIRNILVVQKTDADGKPIANNGTTDNPATFELYKDDGGKPESKAYSTQETTDQKVADGRLGLTDAVSFPASITDTAVLETGKTYWVKETKAPTGYVLNDHWVKVVVTDKGVHADATAYTAVKAADGNITSMEQVASGAKDNISVNEGLGTLVRTMTQWAGDGGDDPLQYITGTLQTGSTAQDGSITWNTPTDSDQRIKFQYGYGKTADTPLLKYGYFSVGDRGLALSQSLDNTTFSVEDGYADVTMRPTNPTALLTDATPLLTGSTIIRVGDETTSVKVQLSFYKQVEGADWSGKTADSKDQNFSFTLKRTDDVTDGKVTYPQTENDGTTTTAELSTNGTVSASTSGEIKQGETNRQLVGVDTTGKKSKNPLPELTFTKNGTYTFTLREDTTSPVAGWKYDDTTHNITVTVSGCDTQCKAEVTENGTKIPEPGADTQSGEIVFTNRFIAVSSLPLTGGDASARDWLIGGSIFAITAALALAATYEYRKRKNLTF